MSKPLGGSLSLQPQKGDHGIGPRSLQRPSFKANKKHVVLFIWCQNIRSNERNFEAVGGRLPWLCKIPIANAREVSRAPDWRGLCGRLRVSEICQTGPLRWTVPHTAGDP